MNRVISVSILLGLIFLAGCSLNSEKVIEDKLNYDFDNSKLSAEGDSSLSVDYDSDMPGLHMTENDIRNYEVSLKLRGEWLNNGDDKEKIEFTDNMKIDFYDDEKVSEKYFKIINIPDIDGKDVNRKYYIEIIGDDEELSEYIIEKIDEKTLLINTGVGEELVEYSKVNQSL